MRMLFLMVPLLQSSWANSAFAADGWASSEATITYHVVHKFHTVDGRSTAAQAKGRFADNGVQLVAWAPVASFLSGNTSRDAHMVEVVQGEKFPTVSVKAVAKLAEVPKPGVDFTLPMDAEVELHGIKTHPKLVAKLHWVNENELSASFELSDSLDAHKIERPKLLFVAIDDLIRIDGSIVMRRVP